MGRAFSPVSLFKSPENLSRITHQDSHKEKKKHIIRSDLRFRSYQSILNTKEKKICQQHLKNCFGLSCRSKKQIETPFPPSLIFPLVHIAVVNGAGDEKTRLWAVSRQAVPISSFCSFWREESAMCFMRVTTQNGVGNRMGKEKLTC